MEQSLVNFKKTGGGVGDIQTVQTENAAAELAVVVCVVKSIKGVSRKLSYIVTKLINCKCTVVFGSDFCHITWLSS